MLYLSSKVKTNVKEKCSIDQKETLNIYIYYIYIYIYIYIYRIHRIYTQNSANTIICNVKANLVPLPREWREREWINCLIYIIDLTSCNTYVHLSSTCKWYLLFVNNSFVEKYVWKIVNSIYTLLGNNHHDNIFSKVITIEPLFASAKPSTIADCWGEFWGLVEDSLSLKTQQKF